MQKMSNWEIKSVVALDRELLNKGGLLHRFDCILIQSVKHYCKRGCFFVFLSNS